MPHSPCEHPGCRPTALHTFPEAYSCPGVGSVQVRAASLPAAVSPGRRAEAPGPLTSKPSSLAYGSSFLFLVDCFLPCEKRVYLPSIPMTPERRGLREETRLRRTSVFVVIVFCLFPMNTEPAIRIRGNVLCLSRVRPFLPSFLALQE